MTEANLLGIYRTAMFLGFAFSEVIAMAGFVFVFQTRSLWIYALSLPFTFYGFWRVGPFRSTFERCDQRLQEQGSPFRMTEAWRKAIQGGSGSGSGSGS